MCPQSARRAWGRFPDLVSGPNPVSTTRLTQNMTSFVPKLVRQFARSRDRWNRVGGTTVDFRAMRASTSTSTTESPPPVATKPTNVPPHQTVPPGTFGARIAKPWCEALVDISRPGATDFCLDLASGVGTCSFVVADQMDDAKLWGPPSGAGALGGGHNTTGSVLGLDRSRAAIDTAKASYQQRANNKETNKTHDATTSVRFEWCDADDKDAPWQEKYGKKFARAYCANGLQFFQNPTEACRRVKESLTPGGVFLVSVWGPLDPKTQPLFFSAYASLAKVLNEMRDSDGWVNGARNETINHFSAPFSWVDGGDQTSTNQRAIEKLEEVLINAGFDAPDAATEVGSHCVFDDLEQAALACVGELAFFSKFKQLDSGRVYRDFLEVFETELLKNAGDGLVFRGHKGTQSVMGSNGEGSVVTVPATAYFAHATAPWR